MVEAVEILIFAYIHPKRPPQKPSATPLSQGSIKLSRSASPRGSASPPAASSRRSTGQGSCRASGRIVSRRCHRRPPQLRPRPPVSRGFGSATYLERPKRSVPGTSKPPRSSHLLRPQHWTRQGRSSATAVEGSAFFLLTAPVTAHRHSMYEI